MDLCHHKSLSLIHILLEEHTGVLLIRELPDSVKKKETEAEVYAAVWSMMIEIEKSLPMSFVFYGQDTLTCLLYTSRCV